jgi:hypothetical protein
MNKKLKAAVITIWILVGCVIIAMFPIMGLIGVLIAFIVGLYFAILNYLE